MFSPGDAPSGSYSSRVHFLLVLGTFCNQSAFIDDEAFTHLEGGQVTDVASQDETIPVWKKSTFFV